MSPATCGSRSTSSPRPRTFSTDSSGQRGASTITSSRRKDASAQEFFSRAVRTLLHNLDRYDLGFWSLYEQSGTRLPMVASPFYHQLHIVQLRVMHRLTGEDAFARVADRWESYSRSRSKRTRALCYKSAFKLCYY